MIDIDFRILIFSLLIEADAKKDGCRYPKRYLASKNHQSKEIIMAIAEYGTSTSYTINSKRIPHASFPVGGEYKDELVPNTFSCLGFGKYISNYLYGKYDPGTVVAKQSIKSNNETLAYNVISSFKSGSRLTGFKNGSQIHTWILVSADTSGAVIYHANFGAPYNNVKLSKWTYGEFQARYDEISGYNAP